MKKVLHIKWENISIIIFGVMFILMLYLTIKINPLDIKLILMSMIIPIGAVCGYTGLKSMRKSILEELL